MKNSKTVMLRYIGLLEALATLIAIAVVLLMLIVGAAGIISLGQPTPTTFPLLKTAGLLGLIGALLVIVVVGLNFYVTWMALAAYLQTTLNIEENTEDTVNMLLQLSSPINRLLELLEERTNPEHIPGGQHPPPGQAG